MWLEDALKVVSQAHSELFLGSKGETRRAPPSARDAAVTSEDVHPAHPTSSRVRHNPFETRVGAANAADRLGRHLGARSAERGGVGGRATQSRFKHRFHPYATADHIYIAGAASAFKTPPRTRARLFFLGLRATATGRAGLDSRTLCSRRSWQSRGTRRRLASRHTPRGAARTASASATETRARLRLLSAPAFPRRRRRVGGASSRRAPPRCGPRAGSCPPAASRRRT